MGLSEYAYKDTIHRCFRCGYCKFPPDWGAVDNCPAYARHRLESYSCGGRLWLIRAWLDDEIAWSKHLGEIVYSCTGCKNCTEKCPLSFSGDIFDAQFKELGARKIVTLSPHAYNTFKNDYPALGGCFDVYHYTQLLHEARKEGKIDVTGQYTARVTYHDPCFLGRWNGQYDAPRELLRSIPGVELVEMDRNRNGSLCCGGGGGNFYTDFLGGGGDAPARIRIRQAHATGAEVLATACPNCLTMLEDAVKVEGLEETIKVRDIAEMVAEVV